jgi:hypothetical protein
LWLVAEAGHTYELKQQVGRDGARFWFVDAQTGAVVGGVAGGADDPVDPSPPGG